MTEPERYVLGWHSRGPRKPLPLVRDTRGRKASEVFVSEANARAELDRLNREDRCRTNQWAQTWGGLLRDGTND